MVNISTWGIVSLLFSLVLSKLSKFVEGEEEEEETGTGLILTERRSPGEDIATVADVKKEDDRGVSGLVSPVGVGGVLGVRVGGVLGPCLADDIVLRWREVREYGGDFSSDVIGECIWGIFGTATAGLPGTHSSIDRMDWG